MMISSDWVNVLKVNLPTVRVLVRLFIKHQTLLGELLKV